jgi:2-oxoglutarate dehydrogenase E2 component (dihydrolipoamide succinyltransferase)
MSVSVTMPRLGESVTEGTVTRWLKKEGERVEADEPLLEVSTDKVDTEIPAPTSGVLSAIRVGEDETVEVGVELAVIDEGGTASASAPAQEAPQQPGQQEAPPQEQPAEAAAPAQEAPQPAAEAEPPQPPAPRPAPEQQAPQPPAPHQAAPQQPAAQEAAPQGSPQHAAAQQPAPQPPTPQPVDGQRASAPQPAAQAPARQEAPARDEDDSAGAYVTPLVRKLAAENDVDLSTVSGTGVGGRIRKQDVLEAARSRQSAQAPAEPATQPAGGSDDQPVQVTSPVSPAPGPAAPAAVERMPAARVEPSPLRGTTEKMSRLRATIARRMVESLQVSAQLTTVVEVDVTRVARLRQLAKADFQRREGVKLSFLPFFALAAVEALKQHPNLNASIDSEAGTVTYHEAEHLGIAVDTERGLLVPVIHDAGDLNLGGVARKIADLAERTRTNKVSPDELGGGTFTLTNTGSRGALFDTPIINQPQVGILGTGSVVKRPVVVDDPDLGEVIAVRSMVYLALTYDHRIVDGADAARFLVTVKERLEAGAYESELGLS